jgi:hypothetical protein
VDTPERGPLRSRLQSAPELGFSSAIPTGPAEAWSSNPAELFPGNAYRLEHFHNCCGADWLICGRLAIGLLDSAWQAKRIANPLQDTILPHNICENALKPVPPLQTFERLHAGNDHMNKR